MKRTLLFLIIVFITACNGKDEKADAYGNFEADDLIVSAQANGEIIQMSLEEGQTIARGQIVGLIDTTTLYLQKKQLKSKIKSVNSNAENIRAQIAVQNQQLQNLERDRKRIQNLNEKGAATDKQLDDIQGAVDVAEKQLLATKTKLQGIKDEIGSIEDQIAILDEKINKSFIRNPIQGTVLTKYATEGEFTATGKPVYKIANLSALDLKLYVSGHQLPDIKLGQQVEVLIDKNKEEYTHLSGDITWISSNAEFTPKTIQTREERVNLVYAVKVKVKNDGSLKIGMPAEVNF